MLVFMGRMKAQMYKKVSVYGFMGMTKAQKGECMWEAQKHKKVSVYGNDESTKAQ